MKPGNPGNENDREWRHQVLVRIVDHMRWMKSYVAANEKRWQKNDERWKENDRRWWAAHRILLHLVRKNRNRKSSK